MITSNAESMLIRSNGAELLTPHELKEFEAPPPSGRWYPMSHYEVFSKVSDTLTDAGFVVNQSRLAVSKNGHRFFGTLDLGSLVADGKPRELRPESDQELPPFGLKDLKRLDITPTKELLKAMGVN